LSQPAKDDSNFPSLQFHAPSSVVIDPPRAVRAYLRQPDQQCTPARSPDHGYFARSLWAAIILLSLPCSGTRCLQRAFGLGTSLDSSRQLLAQIMLFLIGAGNGVRET